MLQVSVEGAEAEAQFHVRVFPAGYWDPLSVVNNQTLHVEESTSVPITNNFLQVFIYSNLDSIATNNFLYKTIICNIIYNLSLPSSLF